MVAEVDTCKEAYTAHNEVRLLRVQAARGTQEFETYGLEIRVEKETALAGAVSRTMFVRIDRQ